LLQREGLLQHHHAALPDGDRGARERQVGDLRRPVGARAARLLGRGLGRQAASRPQTEAAARRRRLLAWLFDWVVGPALAIGVLLTAWFSTSP